MLKLDSFKSNELLNSSSKMVTGGKIKETTYTVSDGSKGGDTVNYDTCQTSYENPKIGPTNDPNMCGA